MAARWARRAGWPPDGPGRPGGRQVARRAGWPPELTLHCTALHCFALRMCVPERTLGVGGQEVLRAGGREVLALHCRNGRWALEDRRSWALEDDKSLHCIAGDVALHCIAWYCIALQEDVALHCRLRLQTSNKFGNFFLGAARWVNCGHWLPE